MTRLDPGVRTIGGGHAVGVGLASVYAAGVSYLVLLIAAHHLDPARNAVFLVFWAVLFGGFGVVTGVSPEAARASYPAGGPDRPDGVPDQPRTTDRPGGRIIPLALVYGAVVAALILLSGIGWGPVVLPGHGGLVALAASACFAYAGHLALWGSVTGQRRWRAVALLQAGESTVRLVAVALALLVSGSLVALAVGSAVSAAAWVLVLWVPTVRSQLTRRADVTPRRLLANYARTSGASAASAVLTVGYPVLIALTSTRPELLGAAGLLLAITLARAPLMVPLTAFQGVALTHFLRHRERGVRALLPVIGVVLALSVVAAGAAWLLGPWLYHLLLGGRYSIAGPVLAGLVVSAGLLAVLTIAGMCCLALRRHTTNLVGWWLAALVAVGALLLPLDLSSRVVLSLCLGPLAGIGAQLVGLAGAPSGAAGEQPEHR